jgi:nucleotide-binding universal stress UspA family protein
MYKNIAVAYDDSPEAARALVAAIDIAKTFGVGLQSITVMEKLPSYTAFATATDPALIATLEEDRLGFYRRMRASAQAAAEAQGVQLVTHAVEGEAVEAIVHFVCDSKIDLLVIGLHRRPSRISSLWSTVYTIAQNIPCSVLGVH